MKFGFGAIPLTQMMMILARFVQIPISSRDQLQFAHIASTIRLSAQQAAATYVMIFCVNYVIIGMALKTANEVLCEGQIPGKFNFTISPS